LVILGKIYILRVQTNRAENEKIAKNDQTETIVWTYNQNTYTLLYKLQRRDESTEQSVNITYLTIFASQGLPPAPLPFTLGRLSQNFVIPAYRPLADLWSTTQLHYIIIYQYSQSGRTLKKGNLCCLRIYCICALTLTLWNICSNILIQVLGLIFQNIQHISLPNSKWRFILDVLLGFFSTAQDYPYRTSFFQILPNKIKTAICLYIKITINLIYQYNWTTSVAKW
jgi:hypothetical protein